MQKTICTLCTGFFCLAIIKGPPNDNYFIIEGPCLDYFTEKVSQTQKKQTTAATPILTTSRFSIILIGITFFFANIAKIKSDTQADKDVA